MQFLDIFGLKQLKNWINNKFYTKTEVDNKIPNLENYATKDDVSDAIEDLIGTAPTALDTLGEIAEALSNGEAVESALTNQIAAKYTKPSTGIPATDLTSDVQSALNKANSAIQNETDPIFSASAASTIQSTDIENWNSKTSNTGTITGITMNGVSKGTSGVVNLGTVLTEHQDISGKANTSDIKNATLTLKANNTNYATTFSANAATDTIIDLGYMVHTVGTGSDIQSGNIKLKTINNNSILGEGNVDTTEIVYVEYDTTPYSDVAAAVSAGKQVICLMNGMSLSLVSYGDNEYFFSTSAIRKMPDTEAELGTIEGQTISGIIGVSIDSTNGWSDPYQTILPDLTNVESTTNKVTSLSESSTDTQYPSAKAVYDMITDDEQVVGAALNNLNARIATNQYEMVDYQTLCDLRDDSQLIPGKQYCITNYYATTTDPESRAQNHLFYIIVTALTENKLSEEARACSLGGNSYYANNNLAAWKVWYCLDNDTTRFAWADTNGAGVIYRLIDEFGNDAPYDFKNIQFKRYKVTAKTEYADYLSKYNGLYIGLSGTQTKGFDIDTSDYKWFYTFSSLGSDWTTDATDASITGTGAGNNTFKTTESINRVVPFLNNVVIMSGEVALNYVNSTTTPASVAQDNHFEENCNNITGFGGMWNNFCQSQFKRNVIIGEFRHNTIGSDYQDNLTIGTEIIFNNIDSSINDNLLISADRIYANKIKAGTTENLIVCSGRMSDNTLGVYFYQNNVFCSNFSDNEFGTAIDNNTFNCTGLEIAHNYFNNNIKRNTFNGRVTGNEILKQTTDCTFGAYLLYNTFKGILQYITTPTGSASSMFAYNDVSGAIRGTSSAPIALDNSAFRIPNLSGVKRRINIEGDPNGNVIATWKDGETIQGVKKASGASTWTTFTIQSGVIPEAATTAPLMDGTAAVGSSAKYAKEDHVHPSDTSKVDVEDAQVRDQLAIWCDEDGVWGESSLVFTSEGMVGISVDGVNRQYHFPSGANVPTGGEAVLALTSDITSAVSGKQDTISDLATIRSGAAAGATAYQKPSTGIPASDLAAGVIPDTSTFEVASNKVTSLSSSSTDTQYPSAKCVYDLIGDIESVLNAL